MKKFMKLIPAFVMLLVSAILVSTATYAWFSMNTTVTATGMQVQATAEDGIVIAAYTDNTTAPTAAMFAQTDTTEADPMTSMHPTFTADLTNWYHASSTQTANGQAYSADGYASVNNVAGVDANSDGDYDDEGDTAPVNYYQINKFQIKSTGSAQAVYVKSIAVSGISQEYSDSIRVAVKTGDASLIFAPQSTVSAVSFNEVAAASVGTSDAITSDVTAIVFTPTNYNKLASKVLNDVGATPEDVTIYIFFDGEDAACKSDNIPDSAFETLTVQVEFTSETPNS